MLGHPVVYWRLCLNDPEARDLHEALHMVTYLTDKACEIADEPGSNSDGKVP